MLALHNSFILFYLILFDFILLLLIRILQSARVWETGHEIVFMHPPSLVLVINEL